MLPLNVRRLHAALLAAAVLAPASAGAQSAFMSLNSLATGHLPQKQCLSRAKAAMQGAGFGYFDASTEAIWGLTTNRRDMLAIYCPPSHDIVVFAASSPTGNGNVTGPLVERLVEAWQKLGK
jgi:hypothetical protein